MPIPTQQTTENILLPFSRDVAGPYYRVKESTQHQAKLELRSLKWMIERYTEVGDTILDPMSGTGSDIIARFMGRNVINIELEEKFQDIQTQNSEHMLRLYREGRFFSQPDMQWDMDKYPVGYLGDYIMHRGDALDLLPTNTPVDAVIFSPPYFGSWTHREQSEMDKQKNYVVGYGDNPNNLGNWTSPVKFRYAMEDIYQGCLGSLRSGGVLVSVVKDRVEKGERVHLAAQNFLMLLDAGFEPYEWHRMDKSMTTSAFSVGHKERRIREGTDRPELNVLHEDVLVVRKPK